MMGVCIARGLPAAGICFPAEGHVSSCRGQLNHSGVAAKGHAVSIVPAA